MKNYMPSNGSEGCWFMSIYCDKCYKKNSCTILSKSLVGNQPKQWIYNENNKPTCTSFNPNRPKSSNKYKPKNNLTLEL